jgi:hypothetical protein
MIMNLAGVLLLLVFFWKRSRAMVAVLFLLALFIALCSYSIGQITWKLGSDSFQEASNFDPREALFYAHTVIENLSVDPQVEDIAWSISAVLLVMGALWLAGLRLPWIRPRGWPVLLAGLGLLAGGLWSSTSSAVAELQEASVAYDSIRERFNSLPVPQISVAHQPPLTLFVYIGESTSSLNMQIYGYPRRTTPKLAALATNDPGLMIFDRVFSTHVHTSPSLLEAFSLRPTSQDNAVPVTDQLRVPLVDILLSKGIRTVLYSNQSRKGTWNLAAGVVFGRADQTFTLDMPIGDLETSAKPLDSDFLPRVLVDPVLTDSSHALLLFHSYAGHGPYRGNVSPEMPTPEWLISDRISTEHPDVVDDYDTAVSGVDANLARTISAVAASQKPIIFVYFSDHGEAVATDDGHDSARFRVEMSTVPFLVYFNEAARRSFPERFAQMKELATTRNVATLAQLIPTLLKLMGVTVDPQAGFDIPPPLGAPWAPYPIVVRSTVEGLSSRRIVEIPAPPGAVSNGPTASQDGTSVCFPDRPTGTQASCFQMEIVTPPQD